MSAAAVANATKASEPSTERPEASRVRPQRRPTQDAAGSPTPSTITAREQVIGEAVSESANSAVVYHVIELMRVRSEGWAIGLNTRIRNRLTAGIRLRPTSIDQPASVKHAATTIIVSGVSTCWIRSRIATPEHTWT